MRKSILSVLVAVAVAAPAFVATASAAETPAMSVKSAQVENTVFALLSAQQKLDMDRSTHADADAVKMDEAAVDQLYKTLSGLTGAAYPSTQQVNAKAAEAIVQRMADDQRKLDMDEGMHAPQSVINEDKARLTKDQSELNGLSGS